MIRELLVVRVSANTPVLSPSLLQLSLESGKGRKCQENAALPVSNSAS